MKILLAIALVLITFGTFASNKICIGEKVIVAFNEPLKKLVVIDKESFEILQSTSLEGDSFGEIALSSNGSKIWFEMDGKVYCRDMKTGEIVKELQGVNSFMFEFSAANDFLIHYETTHANSLIYVYDLNTTEAISYAKVNVTNSLETCHYDAKKQQLHLLTRPFETTNEQPSKEPQIGFPETAEEIALAMLHDGKESHYYIYDILQKEMVYDEMISYSPGFSTDFEVINDRLYLITQIGTAAVLEDHSIQVTSLAVTNLADYAFDGTNLIGVNGLYFFSYSFEDGSITKLYDDEINKILVEAKSIAVTETDYYAMNEGVFYRIKRDQSLGIDLEVSFD